MQLKIKAGIKIAKSPAEVLEAIVDPKHMSQYFIARSSGRMEPGITVTWQFPEFDMKFPVRVQEVVPERLVSFLWDDEDGSETRVEITLTPKETGTHVSVAEGTRESNEAGIGWLQRNTEGWANFLACMKAYLEYGINLRKGAFGG